MHNMSAPLVRFGKYGVEYDLMEVKRQTFYLMHNRECWYRNDLPGWFLHRRAAQLLACYSLSGQPIPDVMLQLIGALLTITSVPFKYAKKAGACREAQEIVSQEPGISNKALARAVHVHASTIQAWRDRGALPPRSKV